MEQHEAQQQLHVLRDELRSLKALHGQRMVRKRAEKVEGHEKQRTPFPLQVVLEVQQPPPGIYDIDNFKVLLIIDEPILDLSSCQKNPVLAGQAGLIIRVDGANLPGKLRRHIADTLYCHWQEQRKLQQGDSTNFFLETIFERASDDFVALITFFPELLERYEGVNQDGATVRRVAIINDETEVIIDAAVQPPIQEPPLSDASKTCCTQPRCSRPHSLCGSLSTSARIDTAHAVQKELSWLQRRYQAALQIMAEPAAASAEEDAADQLQNISGFRLQMTPTDPAWNRGPVLLTVAVAATYPAPGSMQVVSVSSPAAKEQVPGCDGETAPSTSHPCPRAKASSDYRRIKPASSSQQEGLSTVAAEVLSKLLTAYAAASGGTTPTMAVIRSLDSHGAQYAQQADDMAIEVEAKRRHSAAAATSARGRTSTRTSTDSGSCSNNESFYSRGMSASAAPSEQPQLPRRSSPLYHHGKDPSACPAISGRAATQHHRFGDGLWWPSKSPPGNAAQDVGPALDELSLASGVSSAVRVHTSNGYKYGSHSTDTTPGTSLLGSSCTSDTYSTLSNSESDTDGPNNSEFHDQGPTKLVSQGAVSSRTGSSMTSVALEVLDLSVVNVDIVQPHSLVLQVVCVRCRRTAQVELPAGDAAADSRRIDVCTSCSTCYHAWEVGVSAGAVHETSSILARLCLKGCMAADLLPSLLTAQCSACSAVAAFRQVRVGAQSSRNCSQCYRGMNLRFNAVTFTSQAEAARVQRQRMKLKEPRTNPLAPGDIAANVGSSAVGEPLPDFGACSHYKHSHRWLRFPCCGARFPCDLCHEESTDGHEMKWATRMVCGFCSLEQGLSDRCSTCDKRLASSARKGLSGRSTRFWEGGKGCRDPKVMDRRDRRAVKQRGAKTQSQKDKRVGQQAKEMRERKKETARH